MALQLRRVYVCFSICYAYLVGSLDSFNMHRTVGIICNYSRDTLAVLGPGVHFQTVVMLNAHAPR